MSGAWRSLVARVLWELPIIQTKSIAIYRFRKNITVNLVRVSEDLNTHGRDAVSSALKKYFIINSKKYKNKLLFNLNFDIMF